MAILKRPYSEVVHLFLFNSYHYGNLDEIPPSSRKLQSKDAAEGDIDVEIITEKTSFEMGTRRKNSSRSVFISSNLQKIIEL